MQKIKTRLQFVYIYKNKMEQRPNYKTWNNKIYGKQHKN